MIAYLSVSIDLTSGLAESFYCIYILYVYRYTGLLINPVEYLLERPPTGVINSLPVCVELQRRVPCDAQPTTKLCIDGCGTVHLPELQLR